MISNYFSSKDIPFYDILTVFHDKTLLTKGNIAIDRKCVFLAFSGGHSLVQTMYLKAKSGMNIENK